MARQLLLHFSEDPAIGRFEPHRPVGREDEQPRVWAIDAEHAPLYWFPRDCPRVTFWPRDEPAQRVHAIEWGWLERMRAAELYVYRFDPEPFETWEGAEGHWVSSEVVEPLGVDLVGDLLVRHTRAGIELRLVTNLWPLHRWAIDSGLEFSSVRLRNGQPEPMSSS